MAAKTQAAGKSRPRFKVKKGDRVMVLTGRDKGVTGEILKMLPDEARCIVQGVNMVSRHQRPTPTGEGGIIRKEASIHVSNVAHVDPADPSRPTRVGYRIDGERKVRVARRSGDVIDR